MTDEKKTITTLSSIVNPEEVKVAIDLWESGTKDTLKALKIMGKIGTAINLIYDTGESKSIKRDVVTQIVQDTFVGLDRRERSDFRAIAKNLTEIETHAESKGIKSLNPTYLLNQWRSSVKPKAEKKPEADIFAAGVLTQVTKEVKKLGDQKETPKKATEVSKETPIKTGYDNIVRPNPLSGKEVIANVGAAVNHAITYFNQGKLNADDLATLEKHLTKTLQHINRIEEDDMLLTASL